MALGAIRNKLVFTPPVALLLNHFLPALLPIILLVGGTYLAFEKVRRRQLLFTATCASASFGKNAAC
ncbi:DUF808 domain-containing protein [Halomonas alkaliphila]|uniref:DUF808 domain-containing protein n=1 Tax=Vreelandella alkaliphila TaxID=272774 RepID=A0A7C9JS14_9GAMM|nr:DUF808 domain-containing protein [Halomonas alkaliphila]